MAKLHYMPGRASDAETSFRELAESDAPAPAEPQGIKSALRGAAEPKSRPAGERVSEVRVSAPSTIEEAILRAVDELDAFVPIEPHRPMPKA